MIRQVHIMTTRGPEIETTALVIASVGAPAIVVLPVVFLALMPLIRDTLLEDGALRVLGVVLAISSFAYLILVPLCLMVAILLRRLDRLHRRTLYLLALLTSVLASLTVGLQWLRLGDVERALPAATFFAALVLTVCALLIEAWFAIATRLSKNSRVTRLSKC